MVYNVLDVNPRKHIWASEKYKGNLNDERSNSHDIWNNYTFVCI